MVKERGGKEKIKLVGAERYDDRQKRERSAKKPSDGSQETLLLHFWKGLAIRFRVKIRSRRT